jgi:hypothetical protein
VAPPSFHDTDPAASDGCELVPFGMAGRPMASKTGRASPLDPLENTIGGILCGGATCLRLFYPTGRGVRAPRQFRRLSPVGAQVDRPPGEGVIAISPL